MAVPVWVTDTDLGTVFEDDNFLKQVSTQDNNDTFELVITGDTDLSDPVDNLGTKQVTINGTTLTFGTTTAANLDAGETFNNSTVATGINPGTTFDITDLTGTDTITVQIVVDAAGVPTFPLTGSIVLGTQITNTVVDLTGVANMAALVSAINAVTNNTTYGVEAIDNGGVLQLEKDNNFGGDSILIDTSGITAGDLQLTDGVFFVGLQQLVDNINNQVTNTDNIVASVQTTAGLNFLRIRDTATALRVTDFNSGILVTLQLPSFSAVPRADVLSEINALTGTTNVSASLVGSNQLELVGASILLDDVGTFDPGATEVLGLDNAGSELLSSPITEWLIIDNTTGVLQGVTPLTSFTTNVSVTVRATSDTVEIADRTFTFILQPFEAEQQISWSPGLIDTVNEATRSSLSIDVVNFESIQDSASFFVLDDVKFGFRHEIPDEFEFTRKSVGTFFDVEGILKTAGVDEPRFGYDGNDPAAFIGILVEPQVTNEFTFSNEFDNSWMLTNASVSFNAGLSPQQFNNSWKLVPDATNTQHGVEQSIAITTGNDYALSIFAKESEENLLWVRVGSGSSVVFNLTTGVVEGGFAGAEVSGGINGAIVPFKDNWYRCEVTFTSATTSSELMGFYVTQDAGTPTNTFTGNGTDGLVIFGAQFEENSFVTTYIPTTSSPITRRADNLILEDVFNLTYELTITGEDGNEVTSTITVTTRQFSLKPIAGQSSIIDATFGDFPQKKVLPDNWEVESLQRTAGGSGYSVNDTITLDGSATGELTPIIVTVNAVDGGGAVTQFSITQAGEFDTNPSGESLSQASTSGSGTGATFLVNTVKFLGADLTIDNNGDISGNFPFHTAPPAARTISFDVILVLSNSILLGPATFSIDVLDVLTEETFDIQIPTFFFEDDRSRWVQLLRNLVSPGDLFRPGDENFGINANPAMELMRGLRIDTSSLNTFAGLIADRTEFEVVIGNLKFAEGDNFDVLYYEITDPRSTIISYPNPLETNVPAIQPNPIRPKSLDIIRQIASTSIGFETSEFLPSWQTTWFPTLVAAYVEKGRGQFYVNKFLSSDVHQDFVGKLFKVSFLNLIRGDNLPWIEGLGPEFLLASPVTETVITTPPPKAPAPPITAATLTLNGQTANAIEEGPILDSLSTQPVTAWSTRQLSSSYTGPILELQVSDVGQFNLFAIDWAADAAAENYGGTITTPGSGYAVGDVIYLTNPNATDDNQEFSVPAITVLKVDGSGGVLEFDQYTPYSNDLTNRGFWTFDPTGDVLQEHPDFVNFNIHTKAPSGGSGVTFTVTDVETGFFDFPRARFSRVNGNDNPLENNAGQTVSAWLTFWGSSAAPNVNQLFNQDTQFPGHVLYWTNGAIDDPVFNESDANFNNKDTISIGDSSLVSGGFLTAIDSGPSDKVREKAELLVERLLLDESTNDGYLLNNGVSSNWETFKGFFGTSAADVHMYLRDQDATAGIGTYFHATSPGFGAVTPGERVGALWFAYDKDSNNIDAGFFRGYEVATVSIANAGTGYVVSEELTIGYGDRPFGMVPDIAQTPTVTVDSVGGSGEITGVSISNPGLFWGDDGTSNGIIQQGDTGPINTGQGYITFTGITLGSTGQVVTAAAINAAGSGYVVGDNLTVSGGTPSGASAVLTVTSVGGSGEVTGIRVGDISDGYTTQPSNPVSITGGTGTGATFNLTWTGYSPGDKVFHNNGSLFDGVGVIITVDTVDGQGDITGFTLDRGGMYASGTSFTGTDFDGTDGNGTGATFTTTSSAAQDGYDLVGGSGTGGRINIDSLNFGTRQTPIAVTPAWARVSDPFMASLILEGGNVSARIDNVQQGATAAHNAPIDQPNVRFAVGSDDSDFVSQIVFSECIVFASNLSEADRTLYLSDVEAYFNP